MDAPPPRHGDNGRSDDPSGGGPSGNGQSGGNAPGGFPSPELGTSAPRLAWSARWPHLARAAGVEADERLTIALSGGADSMLLLHLITAADPRPHVRAVHVHHGLRGADADTDAEFCGRLCESLGVPLRVVHVELDADGPDLEARAREARYSALCAEARETGHRTIVTGHHADDALETLLMRWVRGSHTSGLSGIPRRTVIHGQAPGAVEPPPWETLTEDPVVVVRPLIHMRREEVRRLLQDRGLDWREDDSNRDPRFTRTRVRHALVPALRRVCGDEGLENLRAFGDAVESLEEDFAKRTAHLTWAPPPFAIACRPEGAQLGGVLQRSDLMSMSRALRRRAMWRLLSEGTGAAPRRSLLEPLLDDLARGRCTRHTLPGRWVLVLRSHELQLLPPPEALAPAHTDHVAAPRNAPAHPVLPFPDEKEESGIWTTGGLEVEGSFDLKPPGIVTLPDGRRLSAEIYRRAAGADVPLGADEVELDAEGLPDSLTVRWSRNGDRFHPLGAPGSKSLRRFLADSGVPRDERGRVPLVCASSPTGDQILWVVGVRPNERWRVRPTTEMRLRLCLHRS